MNNVDRYRWPLYPSSVGHDLEEFSRGDSFSDWNLGDLYTAVPTRYAEKLGAKYGLFVASGTSGLHAALLALNLEPGAEVIVPAMTFIRAVTPLIHLKLVPVLADVDSETGNIHPEAIARQISSKTRALIVVHMWGVPCEMDSISSLCREHGIALIEDFSHAHFSTLADGRSVGSFGDVAFASFQRKKLISVGEGGLIVTSCDDLFDRLREITSPGSFSTSRTDTGVDFSGYGLNLRMSPFSGVIAKSILPHIDEMIERRKETVSTLNELLIAANLGFDAPRVPAHAGTISWYSLKPQSTQFSLQELTASGTRLWQFSSVGYPTIAEHRFWSKIRLHSFLSGTTFRADCTTGGCDAYLKNRISVSIPSSGLSNGSSDEIAMWRRDLEVLSESTRRRHASL